jgi:phage virion morphogenesis protein
MLTIDHDSRPVLAALQELAQRCANLSPALMEMGEDLVESSKRRFSTSTAPDGTPWESNSQVTMERYLGLFKSSHSKKTGKLTKAGATRAAGKKPLIGETRLLSSTISYQLVGDHTLLVGSPQEYAAMQQFGGTREDFPNLWGDIPARPFLGFSDDDERTVLEVLQRYLAGAFDR